MAIKKRLTSAELKQRHADNGNGAVGELVPARPHDPKHAQELDQAIRGCVAGYMVLGPLLKEMRDTQLYKDLPGFTEQSTYADYCRTVQTLSERLAQRMIRAYLLRDALPEDAAQWAASYLESERQARVVCEKVAKYEVNAIPGRDGSPVPVRVKNPEAVVAELQRVDKAYRKKVEAFKKEHPDKVPPRCSATFIYNHISPKYTSADQPVVPPDPRKVGQLIRRMNAVITFIEDNGFNNPERLHALANKEQWKPTDRKQLKIVYDQVVGVYDEFMEALSNVRVSSAD